jgi:hypothetical protein
MLGFSSKEIPQPFLTLSSYDIGIRNEEEQAVIVSCLKNVIADTSGNQQLDSAPFGCDDVVSQPIEASSVGLASSSSCQEWEMDDMVMMDLLWQESSEI